MKTQNADLIPIHNLDHYPDLFSNNKADILSRKYLIHIRAKSLASFEKLHQKNIEEFHYLNI